MKRLAAGLAVAAALASLWALTRPRPETAAPPAPVPAPPPLPPPPAPAAVESPRPPRPAAKPAKVRGAALRDKGEALGGTAHP